MKRYRKLDIGEWDPYLEEIHALYIVQRKRVKDLIEHFRDKYDCDITYDAPVLWGCYLSL